LVADAGAPASEVGIIEARLAAVVEGSDSFDAVGVDSRAPVGVNAWTASSTPWRSPTATASTST